MGMLVLILLFCAALTEAQSVKIYSEFRRVDGKGNILASDRGGKPREILSPGLMRNTYHSVRIVVDPPRNKWYQFELAQNPAGLGLTVYREVPAGAGSPRPGRLEKVQMPLQKIGAGLEVFWLDMWTPPQALVRRIRIEAQLHDGEGWRIAPMEVRVLKGIAPKPRRTGAALPGWGEPAERPALQALREYVCDDVPKPAFLPLTVAALVRRNAQQDVAIARALQLRLGRKALIEGIVHAAGGEDVDSWCASPPADSPYGPEWYLRVRDYLYREASR